MGETYYDTHVTSTTLKISGFSLQFFTPRKKIRGEGFMAIQFFICKIFGKCVLREKVCVRVWEGGGGCTPVIPAADDTCLHLYKSVSLKKVKMFLPTLL